MLILRLILYLGILGLGSSSKNCFDRGIQYLGSNQGVSQSSSNPENCQQLCQSKAGCQFWTFDQSSQKCQLMSGNDNERASASFISGPKSCESDFELLTKRYCDMELDQKRAFLAGNEVTATETEKLLASVR